MHSDSISVDKVCVAFLHPGDVKSTFAECLMRLMLHDVYGKGRLISHDHGIVGKRCASAGIVAGRNGAVQTMLGSQADWLLFIDSDMAFAEDTLERLIAVADPVDRPVVGALAFAVKKSGSSSFGGQRYACEPTLYRAPDLAVIHDYPRNQLVKVGATGAACILAHRSALERIQAEWGDTWFDHIPAVNGGSFSEDLSFCIRLDKLDIPLYVHTGIKTSHDKGVVCFDEELYDQQRRVRPSIPTITPAPTTVDAYDDTQIRTVDGSTSKEAAR